MSSGINVVEGMKPRTYVATTVRLFEYILPIVPVTIAPVT
jgi:hypothetical protein